MKRCLAKELIQASGKKVLVKGWMHSIRSLGKVHFLLLRDISGLIQVVIEKKETFQKVKDLQVGSVFKVEGEVIGSNSDLKVEIVHPKIEVVVPINLPPPVDYYKPEIQSDLDFILDHRPLALRNRKIQAVFKIQAELVHAFRAFMHDVVGATEYFAPNLIGASSEGGAEFFHVDYFGHTATLAQSSQLYKQMMVGVFERVFALMPFFRAEPSHTTRHLSEGKQFEFEMGFFDSWEELMDLQEACIRFLLKHLKKTCKTEIELLDGHLVEAPDHVAIPRLTFDEAQGLYFKRTGKDERNELDLSPAAERELCAWAKEERGTDFVFITDWKTEKRPFYAYPNDENPEISNTFDLLCAGTEITSGGQRRHTLESMVEGIKEKDMDPENFEDYLSIFKYGMPPHGGFGMGLERLTMTFLGLKNIREASLFPSDTKRIAGVKIKARIFFGKENIRNEIIRLCHEFGFEFKHLKHEPTPTSKDSAKVRDIDLSQGVKALILRGKSTKKNYQFNILSHMKVDMKKVASLVGEKCEFEKPEVILERFGLEIGGIPPFGNLLNLDNYFDLKIENQEQIAFNAGFDTESILMQRGNLVTIADVKWADFSSEA